MSANIVFGLLAKDQASAALAKVRSELGLLSGAASRVGPALAGVAGALGVGFSAAGFVAFAAKVRDELLAIKDLSEATGATIESISRLENVARAAGGTLDDVSGVLVKFNAALKDADGANRASQVLRAIGLDAKELRDIDPGEALRRTAVALSQFADDGEKARAVQELFGKSVREAGPLLRELAENQGAQATVTRQQVEEMDRFNKQLAALQQNLNDLGRASAGPAIQAINGLIGVLRGNEAGREFLLRGDLAFVERQLAQIERQAQRAQRVLADQGGDSKAAISTLALQRRLREQVESLRAELQTLQRRRGDMAGLPEADYSNEGRNAIRRLALPPPPAPAPRASAAAARPELVGPPDSQRSDAWLAAMRAIEGTDTARLEAIQQQIRMLIFMRQAPGADTERVDQALQSLAQQLVALEPAAAAAQAAQTAVAAALAATPAAEMARAAALAEQLWAALGQATDPAQIEQLNQALAKTLGLTEQTGEAAEKTAGAMSTFADQASRNIQNALGDTLEQVLSGNFSNIGRMWTQLLVRMAAQAAAARLSQLIFGTVFQAGGSLGPWGQALRSFFGGGRASGGPVQPGMTYLVGERGPELLHMGGSAGRITPNHELGGGGGYTYSPTIVVQGDVGPATVRLVEQAMARERARGARQAYLSGAGA